MNESILDKLRKELRPNKSADATVKQFVNALQKNLKDTEVMAGGSYAKGTFIKGSHDIDVFVRFPRGTKDEDMAKTIKKALPKAAILHGSRDYFQLTHKGFDFEVVPVQYISDWKQATNVTDMSPLHVAYIRDHLTDAQKDDARLAKHFCKAAGIYGAESYIRGFSGYVLELLIVIYGSFDELLHASKAWQRGMVLDPIKHYRSAGEAARRLNEAKIISPLILIDPLQPERNAAAALSQEAFDRFRDRGQQFLAAPGKEFFDIEVSKPKIQSEWKGKHVLFVTAQTPKGKQDVVGCQVLAHHERALTLFREHEFPLVHAEWRFGEKTSLCWYVLEETKLSTETEQRGPPSDMRFAIDSFKVKHPKAYERDGRWHAIIKRSYTNASHVLKDAWKGIKTQ